MEQAKIEEIATKRMREGDLRGALDKDNGKAEKGKGDKKDEEPLDYQLSRAVDLIRGVSLYSASHDMPKKEKE